MTTDSAVHPLAALDALATRTDLIAHHAAAVRTSIELVDEVRRADLRLPTPCADWTLHDLLTHSIAQHLGFAAAARGDRDPAVWKVRPLGDDPAGEYRAAAETVLAAFAEPGVLQRRVPLVEFGGEFSGAQAVGFHFVDYVVHAWDIARTLGLPVRFDAAVLAAADTVAAVVPGGAARTAPGSPFGPEVPWSGGDALARVVAQLGRDPRWRA
ncbi:TIGR03086 family metal-binding protein [Nocardia harenae]|uniref:TIGR03086 family metal-binding protein n=1 Tax=Nocardia harenae TaxID=358707 RepID=UPI0009FC84CE|nr:TIGR03086 family metal-binding protein [Nocardia harenae]